MPNRTAFLRIMLAAVCAAAFSRAASAQAPDRPFIFDINVGIGAKPDASFDRRQGNSIQYWSPNIAGFTVRLAHSVNEGKDRLTPIGSQAIKALQRYFDLRALDSRSQQSTHAMNVFLNKHGESLSTRSVSAASVDEWPGTRRRLR